MIAPLIFAFVAFNIVLNALTPGSAQNIKIDYVAAQSKAVGGNQDKAASSTASSKDKSESVKSAVPISPSTTIADQSLYLESLQYRGGTQYATASALIYLVSAAMLLFSLVIVYRRLQGKWLAASLIFFLMLGSIIAFCLPKPRGRELLVENLLNAADLFPNVTMNGPVTWPTGDRVAFLVSINTIIALVPVGMLLMALAGLSIRYVSSKIDRADLILRRNCLRIALGLGSVLFVIGVLANRQLMDWPLSLVSETQNVDLQPIADTVTVQLGAMGTMAIIAAFAPAITAWWLDVERYRQENGKKSEAVQQPVAPIAAKHSEDGTKTSKKTAKDEFVFAPLQMITGIIAALAPLLASPFVDALKSVLVSLGGK